MESMQAAIGRLLFIGVALSFVLVVFGGAFYLWQHGAEVVSQSRFASDTIVFKSLTDLLRGAWEFSSLGIIQLGLFVLVFTQLLRVALTTWFFIKLREKVFIGISFFILIVLVYSLFWKI